jgi:hypothetical protein
MMLGTIAILARDSYDSFDHRRLVRRILSLTLPGAVAVACGATFGVWILHQRSVSAPEFAAPPIVAAAPKVAPNPYGALIDPGVSFEAEPDSLANNVAPPASLAPAPAQPAAQTSPAPPAATVAELEDVVPVPPRRPREFEAPTGDAAPLPPRRPDDNGVAAAAPSGGPNFLQRFLGISRSSGSAVVAAPPPATAVTSSPRQSEAYADPRQTAVGGIAGDPRQAGILGIFRSATASPSARYDQYTAVYDLSAHVVYLPDGTRLEAHSGLGNRLDDPRHVDERMRGATPPHMYELTAREGSFHGVQALRLTPIGEGGIFGRAGLLAHPYMLGPNGDSNGCVSIRDYAAFLQAYERGQVKRLAVVANL